MTKPKTEEALHQRVLDILERRFPKVDTMVCQTTDKRSYTATLETSELADIVWFPSMGGYSARVLGHLNVLQFEAVTEALRLLDAGVATKTERAIEALKPEFPSAHEVRKPPDVAPMIRLVVGIALCWDSSNGYKYCSNGATRLSIADLNAITRALLILNERPPPNDEAP